MIQNLRKSCFEGNAGYAGASAPSAVKQMLLGQIDFKTGVVLGLAADDFKSAAGGESGATAALALVFNRRHPLDAVVIAPIE